LRDLPKQKKIHRELCGGGDPPIFLPFPYSHEKDFLMGQIRKIQKKRRRKECKECRKEKEEIVAYMAVPILMCSPSVEKHPHAKDPPSGECTHVGTSTTTFNA
jgi:hypothetical protein